MDKSIIYVGIFDIDEIINYCTDFGPSHSFQGAPKSAVRKGKENKYEIFGLRKVNPYIKIEFTIKLFWEMQNPVDIKQGESIKTVYRGKLRATIDFNMETDYQKRFEPTKSGKLDKKVFEQTVKDEIDDVEDRMIDMMNEWRDGVKQILNTVI